MKWLAAVNTVHAVNLTFIGNSIAGSEKVGLITAGTDCDDEESHMRFRDNEVGMNRTP